MKKLTFVVLALIVFTVFSIGSFAGWEVGVTEKLVGKSGKIDVEYIKPNYSPNEITSSNPLIAASLNRTKKAVNIKIDNIFPGGSVKVLTEQKNTGTLPVKLKNVVVDLKQTDAVMKDDIQLSFNSWLFDKDGKKVSSTKSITCDLKDYETKLNELLAGKVLKPDEGIAIGDIQSVDKLMTIKLKSSSGNDSMGKVFEYELKFNWELEPNP